jgi:hypothetical protein
MTNFEHVPIHIQTSVFALIKIKLNDLKDRLGDRLIALGPRKGTRLYAQF